MAEKKIGPWPLGIDMLSTDENFPTDRNGSILSLRDSLNGDFTREGWWQTRPGLQRRLAQEGLHSLWGSNDGADTFGVRSGELVRVLVDGDSVTLSTIATLLSDQPVDFALLNGEIVFSSLAQIGVIGAGDIVRPLSVPNGELPAMAVTAAGGLAAGRYSAAISFVDARGEEGGLSPLATVNVQEGGGIRLTFPVAPAGIQLAKVYRTEANGGMLRLAATAPLAMGTYLLGAGQLGRPAETQFLRAMRPGAMVRQWNGRLLTGRGSTLCISEPMRYGLYSPRHGFVQFPAPIAFIEGVDGGIYVGLAGRSVAFLRGSTPKEFTMRESGAKPVPRSSVLVQSNILDPGLQLGGDVALWLSEKGYVIGSADGQLLEQQANRIRLSAGVSGRTAVFDRRVLTIVNA